MQACFYLFIFLHIAEGCISNNKQDDVAKSSGESVELPCSCDDPQNKAASFNWSYRKKDVVSYNAIYPTDETNRYSSRVQRVNGNDPGNFTITISHLTVEDTGDYQCRGIKTSGFITVHLTVTVLTKTTARTTRPNGVSTTTASSTSKPETTLSTQSLNAGSTITSNATRSHGGNITPVSNKPKTGSNKTPPDNSKTHTHSTTLFSDIIPYLHVLVPILLVLLLLLICVLCWAYKAQKKSKEQRSEEGKDGDDVTYATVTWKSGKKPAGKAPKEHSNDEEVLYAGIKGSTVEKQNDEDVLYVSMKGNTVDKQACVSNDENALYVSMKGTTVDKQEDVTYATVNKSHAQTRGHKAID